MLFIATKRLPAGVQLVRVETQWGPVVVSAPGSRHIQEARLIASWASLHGAGASVLMAREVTDAIAQK